MLAVTLSFGCSSLCVKKSQADNPIEFETVAEGKHSLADTALVILVDNSEQWGRTWNLAQGNIDPMPVMPEINFKNEMILAVFMGERTSGGFSTEIESLTESKGVLQVKVNNYSRKSGMMLPVLTSPFHIVKFPERDYKLIVKITEIDE